MIPRTDRQTDRQTTCNLITALFVASRGKNQKKTYVFSKSYFPVRRPVRVTKVGLCRTLTLSQRLKSLRLQYPVQRGNQYLYIRATGNSRSGSQKFPPLSVKIPENSRYENTPVHPMCKRHLSKSSFIYQLLINPSSKASVSDEIRSFDFPNISK